MRVFVHDYKRNGREVLEISEVSYDESRKALIMVKYNGDEVTVGCRETREGITKLKELYIDGRCEVYI